MTTGVTPAASGNPICAGLVRPVCMVATTTVAAVAAVAGALLIVGLYLVYAYGKYRHADEPGVVDMNDYRNTRLQIKAVNEDGDDGGN